MAKKQLFTLCILCFLTVALVCGCISDTEKKLEQATTLIESANEKLTEVEDLEWNRENLGFIKAQFAGAEVDLDEAVKVLYTIEPANDEEKRTIDACVVMCTAAKDLCNVVRTDLADGMEHMLKAEEYADRKDMTGAKSELKLAKPEFVDTRIKLQQIQAHVNGISVHDLPAEERGMLTSFKMSIDEFLHMLTELVDTLNTVV